MPRLILGQEESEFKIGLQIEFQIGHLQLIERFIIDDNFTFDEHRFE